MLLFEFVAPEFLYKEDDRGRNDQRIMLLHLDFEENALQQIQTQEVVLALELRESGDGLEEGQRCDLQEIKLDLQDDSAFHL